jgi:hypothetical protein
MSAPGWKDNMELERYSGHPTSILVQSAVLLANSDIRKSKLCKV